MDSFGDDTTLPLNLETSANITRFQDITNMSHLGQTENDLSVTSASNMSPNTSRNMKDYVTQISELKKENFSLKLRIFHMEERMQDEFNGDHEQVFKTNIELKVECDSLRKELQEKQDLLVKASNAMACIETSGADEIHRVQEDARQELQQARKAMDEKVQSAERELRAVQAEAEILQQNVRDLQDYVRELEEEKSNREQKSDTTDSEFDEKLQRAQRHQGIQTETSDEPQASNMRQSLGDKEKLIDQLHDSLKVNKSVIEALNEEKKIYLQTVEDLDKRNGDLEKNLASSKQKTQEMQTDYVKHIEEQQQKLDEFEIAARHMSNELEKREKQVEEMETSLKDAEALNEQLVDSVSSIKGDKDKKNAKELLMRDKAITGLTGVIQKKDDEISNLRKQLESTESRMEELSNTINSLATQDTTRDEELRKLKDLEKKLRELEKKLKKSEEHCEQLRDENDRLKKLLEMGEERVRTMNDKLKEKDREMNDLAAKYRELEERQKEEERMRTELIKEQDDMAEKFKREKKEFTNLLQKTKLEYEEVARMAENQGIPREALELQEKVYTLENQLKAKQAQLEDATSSIKTAESDWKSDLAELERATKRRDEEQRRELESKERISAAKSIEIERLRNKLREKEDKLQELEVDILQYDRTTREAEDMARLSSQEVSKWKEDSFRKDEVISELIKTIEDLHIGSSGFDHQKLIELIRHNNELKHLLHEEETQAFQRQCENASSPLNPSRKSGISPLTSPSLQNKVTTLQLQLDHQKQDLQDAHNLINELTLELGQNHKQVAALQQVCTEKDSVIEELQISAKPFTIVDSEETYSGTSDDDHFTSTAYIAKKPQKLMKRKQRDRRKNEANLALSPETSHRKLRKEKMGDSLLYTSSEDEVVIDTLDAHLEIKLHKDVGKLRNEMSTLRDSNIGDKAMPESGNNANADLTQFGDILGREQDTYKRYIDSCTDASNSQGDKDMNEIKRSLNEQLSQIESLRKELRDLLFGRSHDAISSRADHSAETISDKNSFVTQENPVNNHMAAQTSFKHASDANIHNIPTQTSDTDTLSIFSDDSDNLVALSRKELREFIANLRKKLDNAEKLNQLLKNQTEAKSKTIEELKNPQKVQQMREELDGLRERLREAEENLIKSEVLVDSLEKEKEVLAKHHKENDEWRLQCRQLQSKLLATEETVRQQSERIRKYHAALTAAGLHGSPMRSARSHPDLLFRDMSPHRGLPSESTYSRFSQQTYDGMNAHTQTSADDTGYNTLSPNSESKFTTLIQTQAKELSTLRKQLKKSKNICKDLQSQLDHLSRYLSSVDAQNPGFSSKVSAELDSCKHLMRKLKQQLSNSSNDASSGNDTDTTWKSALLLGSDALQLQRKEQELIEKEAQIEALEARLQELMHEKQDMDTQTSLHKGRNQSFMGLLTPSSSQHSICPDDNQTTFLQSMVSQATEYYPLPDGKSPWGKDSTRYSTPKSARKSLPMYQRTIAVTEYLPPNRHDSDSSVQTDAQGRHRLPTSSDAENCTASYGGSWNFSPRKSDPGNRHDTSMSRKAQTDPDESNATQTDIITEHLEEIRLLRQRLENSIQTTDLLRDELEKKLQQAESGVKMNDRFESEFESLRRELTRSNEMNSKLQHLLEAEKKMKRNYAKTARDLDRMRHDVAETSAQTDLRAEIDKLNKKVAERENEIKTLKEELKRARMKDKKIERSKVREDLSKMRDDLSRMSEELDESRDLVRSLKSELALYEKIHKSKDVGGMPSPGKGKILAGEPLDISELLAEIKMLRVQLERSIEANKALRRQLEEQLHYAKGNQPSPKAEKLTTINIHHHSPNVSQHYAEPPLITRNPVKSDWKLDFTQEPNETSVLMTPPPSASSCSEDFGLYSTPTKHTKTRVLVPTQGNAEPEKEPSLPYYDADGSYMMGKLSDFNDLKKKLCDCKAVSKSMLSNSSRIPTSQNMKGQLPPNEKQQKLRSLIRNLELSDQLLKTFWPAAGDCDLSGLDFLRKEQHTCWKCGRRASNISDLSKGTRDAGFGSDSSMNSEVDNLRREVGKLNHRLTAQDKLLQNTVSRLQNANRMKQGIEEAIMQQLSVTHDVIKKARGNLEAKANDVNSDDVL